MQNKQSFERLFVRQGHYALEPKLLQDKPAPEIIIERIGEVRSLNTNDFFAAASSLAAGQGSAESAWSFFGKNGPSVCAGVSPAAISGALTTTAAAPRPPCMIWRRVKRGRSVMAGAPGNPGAWD
jgi:hypothetical protein